MEEQVERLRGEDDDARAHDVETGGVPEQADAA
jgi:hypothetical protein